MAGRARQISLRECYEILHLEKGADLAAVKSAYRKRAFELHPDLNPDNPEAGRQFQLLNEAYVALSAMLKPQEEVRQKQAERQEEDTQKTEKNAGAEKAQKAYAEQDVLRDLLSDPFARRVFEDIYSELNRKQTPEQERREQETKQETRQETKREAKQETRQEIRREAEQEQTTKAKIAPLWERIPEKGVKGVVKGWLKRQIDEEQTLAFPAYSLVPGRKIRLQIRRGMSDDLSSVEVTLPPDFQIGKPVRLRGLGKHIGPWRGDLYLTINAE